MHRNTFVTVLMRNAGGGCHPHPNQGCCLIYQEWAPLIEFIIYFDSIFIIICDYMEKQLNLFNLNERVRSNMYPYHSICDIFEMQYIVMQSLEFPWVAYP